MASPKSVSAESAIHFWLCFMPSLPPCPNRLVRLLFISFLARRIVSLGSVQTCDHDCMLILRQSAETSAPNVADHVHIVTTLPRTVSQAQLIEEIKKTSSKWIKALDARYRGFFWQRGYGAFSVSPSQLDAVVQYVKAQQEHHRTQTFQEEYRQWLRRHGVDFDERYVWD